MNDAMDKVQHHITEMYHYLVNSNEALNHDWRCCEFNPTVKFAWLESLDTLEKTLWALSKESGTIKFQGERIYPDDEKKPKTLLEVFTEEENNNV